MEQRPRRSYTQKIHRPYEDVDGEYPFRVSVIESHKSGANTTIGLTLSHLVLTGDRTQIKKGGKHSKYRNIDNRR